MENLFQESSAPVGVNAGQPLARETIEIWDPIQKCKVIRYKDDLKKELYKDLYKGLSIGIEQSLEFGA